MNLFSFSSIILCATCFSLFLFITIFGRNKVSRIWSLFNLSISLWAVGLFFVGSTATASEAIVYWRLAHVGGLFIAIFFYHTVCVFCNINPKKIILFAYLQALVFLFLDLTTPFISSTRFIFGYLYYNKATLSYSIALLFWLLFMSLGHYELTKFYKNNTAVNRNKIRYLFFGFFVGFLGGVTYFLPMYNIDTFPIGNFTIPIYCIIATYAIFKHHLMDIEVVIKKTVVFASLLTIVFGIFVSITFLIQQLVMGGRLLGAAVSCILIIIAYRPIENFLVNITDKYLFQKKYDYKHLIRQFMDELRAMILNVTDIARSTLDFLSTTIHPARSVVFLNNKFTNTYDIIATDGFKSKDYSIDNDMLVIRRLSETGLPINISKDNSQEQLKIAGIEILVPLFIHKELLGILGLGKKKSDEEYTKEDIEVLVDLSGALAIALNNAQLFDEKTDNEKRALVGTLATGINHEISNPLNTITIKLESLRIMSRMGLLAKKTKEEILEEVSNIADVCSACARRIAEITMQISEFAKPEKDIKVDEVNVCEIVNETISFLKHGMILEDNKVEKRFSSESIYASVDKGQLQQIIFNLLKNAAYVIDKDKGRILLSVDKNNDNKVVIKIADNGHGIPQKVLNRLFTPFFTTKEPGKGTGLGLSLVKIMTERNNGIIRVESEEGKGTIFTLVFKGGSHG